MYIHKVFGKNDDLFGKDLQEQARVKQIDGIYGDIFRAVVGYCYFESQKDKKK